MIVRLFAAGVTLMTLGCATVQPTGAEGDAPARGGGTCNAAPAQGLIGQPATSELGTEVLRLTGASRLRWIQQGQAITMEYLEGRVNVELGSGNRVTAISCG